MEGAGLRVEEEREEEDWEVEGGWVLAGEGMLLER